MERTREALAGFQGTAEGLRRVFDATCLDIVADLATTRASVWFFSPDGDAILCDGLYDARTGTVERGLLIRRADAEPYFAAIREGQRVEAPDARTHPATACFLDAYLAPNDIHALLDHIVVVGTEPVAILCCEHCGAPRDWTAADAAYLFNMATLLGIAFEHRLASFA